MGAGTYFYYDKDDAVFWNIKKMVEKRQNLEYSTYEKEYNILEVVVEYDDSEILDLDKIENNVKLKRYTKSIEGKLEKLEIFKKAKNKDAAIINMMFKDNELSGIKLISKIFPHSIKDSYSKIKVCRKMFCVKDNSIIKLIEFSKDITEENFKIVREVSFYNYICV